MINSTWFLIPSPTAQLMSIQLRLGGYRAKQIFLCVFLSNCKVCFPQ